MRRYTRGHMPKNLDEDYVQAGFGSRLEFGKRPALITVDFVRAYLDPSSPLYAGVDGALASACRVLAAARLSHIPTIFTRVEFIPGGSDGGVFYRKVPALRVFDRGSPLGAFGPGLEPREGEFVMTKQYASAFFGTPSATLLNSLLVDTGVEGGAVWGFTGGTSIVPPQYAAS